MRNLKMQSLAIEDGKLPEVGPLVATSGMPGVSARYAFVSTRDIVNEIVQHGFRPVSCQLAAARDARQGFQKHRIEFELPGSPVALDGTRLRLILINSHDRSSAMHLYLGFFRSLCENGIVVGDSFSEPIKVYHVGGPRLAVAINEALVTALERVPLVMQQYQRMLETELGPHERLALFSHIHSALQENEGKNYTKIYEIQRAEDFANDAWTVFNVIQETVTKGLGTVSSVSKLNGSRRFVKARAIKSIERNIKINRLLFDTTTAYLNSIGAAV